LIFLQVSNFVSMYKKDSIKTLIYSLIGVQYFLKEADTSLVHK